jgi:hypothetical protein
MVRLKPIDIGFIHIFKISFYNAIALTIVLERELAIALMVHLASPMILSAPFNVFAMLVMISFYFPQAIANVLFCQLKDSMEMIAVKPMLNLKNKRLLCQK